MIKVNRNLAARAISGDKEAFAEIYYLCYKDFYNFALYTLGSAEDAADVVADVFVEILRGINKLKNPEAFAPWAFKILSIRCKKEISNRIKRRGELDFEEFIEVPQMGSENFLEDISESVSLAKALSELDLDERMIVILHVLHGYKSREIAEMMGKPQSTVSSKLYRSYDKLRRKMEKQEL